MKRNEKKEKKRERHRQIDNKHVKLRWAKWFGMKLGDDATAVGWLRAHRWSLPRVHLLIGL